MRYLLDTCTFLWLIGKRAELSEAALDAIASTENSVFLSSASLWEILVKHRSGRIGIHTHGAPVEQYLIAQREAHLVETLPVDENAVRQYPRLPDIHRDPFDRMLVCQALAHDLVLVTPDCMIQKYPVRSLW